MSVKTLIDGMKYKAIIVILFCICVWLYTQRDTNTEAKYSQRGLPINCRALIADNIQGFEFGEYTAIEALSSIDRNCGRYGYNWGN
jgi:phosphatidylserine synthase